MNIWEIFLLFFSFQAFLLSVFFLVKQKGDKISNILLALFLLAFSYAIFFYVLFWSKFSEDLYLVLCLTVEIPFSLFGPLFYLYIARTVGQKKLVLKDLLHLIPLGLVIYQYGPLYMLSRPDKIEVVTNREVMTIINPIPNFQLFLSVLMLLYGIAAYIKYAKNYKNDLDLKLWLKAISAFYLLFSLTNISYYILVYTSVLNPSLDYFITFSMVLFVSLFSYVGFMYPAIFEGNSFNHVVPFIKYKKTGLSPEFSKEMKDRLVVLMREEKPHLDPDIRLNILANLLDVSRHHASQIINEHFSMNFFDFINYHRIIEAEKLLKSKKESHLSITDIAFQSGFNNRISFYKAFKKNMGTSPSEYRALNPSS